MAPAYPKPEELDAVPTFRLVEIYNELTPAKPITKFSDRATALKRVAAILPKSNDNAKKKVKGERKKRSMYFKFPKRDNIVVIRNEKSLRYKLKEALSAPGGATFEQLVAVTRKWDKDNDKTGASVENVVRRAYEGTRLLHYYSGYGMNQDAEGKISIVEGAGKK